MGFDIMFIVNIALLGADYRRRRIRYLYRGTYYREKIRHKTLG